MTQGKVQGTRGILPLFMLEENCGNFANDLCADKKTSVNCNVSPVRSKSPMCRDDEDGKAYMPMRCKQRETEIVSHVSAEAYASISMVR